MQYKECRVYKYLRKYVIGYRILRNYLFDFKRYIKYSNTFNKDKTKLKLISTIIKTYHVIEKGLTMPEMRFGFGQEKLKELIKLTNIYYDKYGLDNHIIHSLGVIKEYYIIHDKKNNKCLGLSLKFEIETLLNKFVEIVPTAQREYTLINSQPDYSNEQAFILNRKSLRNFSNEKIPLEILRKAVEIGSNSPSACNRQPFKLHVYDDDKKIQELLTYQNGNRGFGHLSDKLLVVTSDLSGYNSQNERNLVWIDGGLFLMNMIYALQSFDIGSCILNWGVSFQTDIKFRKSAEIPEEQNIIALIVCGYPEKDSLTPCSPKKSTEEILHIHG